MRKTNENSKQSTKNCGSKNCGSKNSGTKNSVKNTKNCK